MHENPLEQIDFLIAYEHRDIPSTGSMRYYPVTEYDAVVRRYGSEYFELFKALSDLSNVELGRRYAIARGILSREVSERFQVVETFEERQWTDLQATLAWMGYAPRHSFDIEEWAVRFGAYEPLADEFVSALEIVREGTKAQAYVFPVGPLELLDWARRLGETPPLVDIWSRSTGGVQPLSRPPVAASADELRSALEETRRQLKAAEKRVKSLVKEKAHASGINHLLNVEIDRLKKVDVDRLRSALYLMLVEQFPPADRRERDLNFRQAAAEEWLNEKGIVFPGESLRDNARMGRDHLDEILNQEARQVGRR